MSSSSASNNFSSNSTLSSAQHARCNAPPGLKLKNMDEKNMHNLFLKNMSGLIEVARNPYPPGSNPWVYEPLLFCSGLKCKRAELVFPTLTIFCVYWCSKLVKWSTLSFENFIISKQSAILRLLELCLHCKWQFSVW